VPSAPTIVRVQTAGPPLAISPRALFVLWALFWILMWLVAFEDNRGNVSVRWWEPLVWEGSSCLVASGWLLLQRRVSGRWAVYLAQPWQWFGRHFAWLPVIAISFVVLVYSLRHGIYALTTEVYEHPPWPYLFFYEGIKILLFTGLWLGIIFGLESFISWRRERERLLTLQKHLAESQLARLREQLRPHFLFNSLNTISSLMQVDVERADRLLTLLADLLRASLQAEARQLSSLREELELLRLYARIMQERFAGRVMLTWQIEENALDVSIPTMVLQPLLENAYKHGVECSAAAVAMSVTARRRGDDLEVTVRNSGCLPDSLPDGGIGLRNCRERLALIYGDKAKLTLSSEGAEVVARLLLPSNTRS
jgi:two-component system LytT family sensor kinase